MFQRPDDLATIYVDMVRASTDRLQVDFPQVVIRYGNHRQAVRSIRNNQNAMRVQGVSGAFTVDTTHVIGSASYRQVRTPVAGPMIDAWLDSRRQGADKGVGRELLEAFAEVLVAYGCTGTAWTIVRPEHPVVPALLEDETNAFGGFARQGRPQDLKTIDGVPSLRQIYVANRPMDALRQQFGAHER